MKPKKHLGFNGMRSMLSSCFNQIPEHRQSNKITYSAHDALMSGFACMHFQDPSLLQFQKRLEKKHHKSNLQTLIAIKSIPESTQLRTIISWVTDIEITQKNVDILARGGRCRWKLENECFNTLKNQGYAIDHSYGHGDKNLCFNFYLLGAVDNCSRKPTWRPHDLFAGLSAPSRRSLDTADNPANKSWGRYVGTLEDLRK